MRRLLRHLARSPADAAPDAASNTAETRVERFGHRVALGRAAGARWPAVIAFLVPFVTFMAALASGGRCAFRVVGEVVRVVLLAAADLLLRHPLLALRLVLTRGGV